MKTIYQLVREALIENKWTGAIVIEEYVTKRKNVKGDTVGRELRRFAEEGRIKRRLSNKGYVEYKR